MSGIDEILAGYEILRAGQEAPCRGLHQQPELSQREYRTARCVGGELGKYGFTVQTGIGRTGVVGVLTKGAGPTVLLQAKLDLLPVRENTGVDYASTVTMAANGQGRVDGLLGRIPAPDVALAQHLLPGIAGTAGTCSGPFLSAEATDGSVECRARTDWSARPSSANPRRWRLMSGETEIRSFRVDMPGEAIADLRQRIAATR